MGLQREAVGRGTMAVYTQVAIILITEIRAGLDKKNEQVVYAMTFDQIFFHSSPSLLSILGTLIIVFSAIYVAVSSQALKLNALNVSFVG